jgi:DNA-binding CsgD family transcriptional regulator
MTPGGEVALRAVADDFYDAAYAGEPLAGPLSRFARLAGADGAAVFRGHIGRPGDEAVELATGLLADSIETYWAEHRASDPHVPRGLKRPPMHVFRSDELVPRAELERTVLYRGYMRPHRIGGFSGTYAVGHRDLQVAIALFHGTDRERLGDAGDRALELGFGPVARAIDVAGRLRVWRSRAHDLEATLSHVETPVVWVPRRRPEAVRYANSAALSALRLETGVALAGGRLVVADRRDAAALARVVAGRGPGGLEGSTLTLRGPEGATRVAVRRLPAGQAACGLRAPHVALIFEAPERAPTWAAAVTPRQREVAELLASGATSPEVARHLGLALETVRTHVKAIYERLGIASRAELARVVAGR